MPGKISNFFMKAIINSPLHPLLGNAFGVITVEGCRTGKLYSTPINITRNGDDLTAVSLKSRTWWRNLRGGRQAQLRLAGRQFAVSSEVLESREAVIEGFRQYLKLNSGYAKYYGVHLTDEQPAAEDLERLVSERVIIRFRRSQAITSQPPL